MSCNNITTLLLSDTFSTWFERTNQTIGALNSLEIRGLSANDGTDFKGIRLIDQGSCLYNLNLSTGPFVGFYTTSGENGIYGTGDASSPYNLTLIPEGPTMDADAVTADDKVLISDTDDDGRFKLAPVDSFITKIQGGNNISVSLENNIYTISYVEITFNPTFDSIKQDNTTLQTSTSQVYEAIANNNVFIVNGTLTYEIIDGGNVDIDSVSFKCNNPARISGNANASRDGAGEIDTSGAVKVPHDIQTWFDVDATTISFNAATTSESVADDGTTIVSPPLTDSDNRTVYFGWRFGGCASTVEHNTAEAFSSAGLTSSLNQMTIAGSNPPWNAPSPSNRIYRDPTIIRPFEINISTGGSYIYFVHSENDPDAPDNDFGWFPRLYNDAGTSEITNGLIDIGVIEIGNAYYRVWRSDNTYVAGNLVFNIGGNSYS